MSLDCARIFMSDSSIKFSLGSNCCPSEPQRDWEDNVSLDSVEVIILSIEPLDDIVFWRDRDDECKMYSSFTDNIPKWLAEMLAESPTIFVETEVPPVFHKIKNNLRHLTPEKLIEILSQ